MVPPIEGGFVWSGELNIKTYLFKDSKLVSVPRVLTLQEWDVAPPPYQQYIDAPPLFE